MKTCASSRKCGGCAYIGKPYEESLQIKQKYVDKLLGKKVKVLPIIGAQNPYNYRNKVHAAYYRDRSGKVLYGTYEEGSHKIVSNAGCLIENKVATQITETIAKLIAKFKIFIYDEKTGRGLYRRTLVRVSHLTGDVMVVLVVADPVIPGKKAFIKALRDAHPEISTVIVNVNNRRDSMILGNKSMVEFGRGYIIDGLLDKTFKITPTAFFQINHEQTEKLYAQAIEFCDFKGNERVLDAYCGTGTIGLCMANYVASVTGVELNKEAVICARDNAHANKIENASFIAQDCTEYMLNLNLSKTKYDVIVLDPPRAGTTEEFIKACSIIAPPKICYVSCNPETLARDLDVFEKYGYKAKAAVPVDMFPWTEHVETVCLLSQLSEAPKMEMRVKLTEFDLTEAEAKATYSDIKEYVKEHTGLKVSSLYIAQVKQKYGIIERDCYNLPKSDDSRQPKCPEHKEKAIVEALKHFKMI